MSTNPDYPMFPIPYRIQSINTKAFAISRKRTLPGNRIRTKSGEVDIPPDSVRARLSPLAFPHCSNVTLIFFGQVLYTSIPIGEGPTVVEIYGVAPSYLYVSLVVSLDLASLHNSYYRFTT
jgi:hypothetical protein